MKKFILILSFLSLGINLHAALPPLYQTSAEIKAILADEQLGQKLHSGEMILKIEKNDQGYEIITHQHHLQVNVTYKPNAHPGPSHFKLHFENPTSI